ncbi:MAG TPA: DUF1501 domain-containing protein, partial [Polyangiaceae bacterium]|nr:DUF1501 domain-containing protein [Polyangiaceae bacterium]
MTARSWSRRSTLAALALGPTGLFLSRWAAAAPAAAALGAPKGALVCVFLRGAADGLNIVVPHADSEYYRLRPTIGVPRPGRPGGAIDLDGRFGLHPRLAALKPAYDAHQLALVHAVGSPHPTRSHFEAQDYLETGAVGMRSVRQGWLSHYLTLQVPASDAGLRAVALSERTPLALRGYPEAIALRNLRQFHVSAEPPLRTVLTDGFAQLYAEGSAPAARSGRHALEVADRLRRIARAPYTPDHGASYAPEAQPFADVARLIKADVGLETAWIDLGGWDTHKQQGASEQGELPRRLDQLGKALAAF